MKIKKIDNRKLGILNLISLISTYIWISIYGIATSNTHESFHALGESKYSLIFDILLTIFLLSISIINFLIAKNYKKEQRKRISKIYIANSIIIFYVATQEIILKLAILLRDTISKMLNKKETIISFSMIANSIKTIAIICYILIFILNIILIITKPKDKGLNKDKIAKKIKKVGILFILITIFVIGAFTYSKTKEKQSNISVFNSRFRQYEGDDKAGDQVKNLVQQVISSNAEEKNEEKQIKIKSEFITLEQDTETKRYTKIEKNEIKLKERYKISFEYGENNMIKAIKISL